MKKLLYILLSAILAAATACHHRSAASLGDFDISLYAPAYSSGFEIFGAEGMKSTILKTYAPWQGAEGEETQLFIARNGEQAPADFPGQVLDGDARHIVCMSSTYIAMLDALGEPQRVVGVSGIDYISNPYVASHKEQIGDVGYDGNMNYERLLSLSPDIVLLFGVSGASAMEPKLRELGIPYAYMGEYLEQSPLGKAEWLVAVAEIAGMRERGEEVFREIPFRYYSPEMGIYISSDPIGLAGGFNTYAYVKDTNTWVDVLGLSGELVYQLIRDNKVVYYGITSRTALERMAEHGKTKVFDNMEILADGLTHDQARSIEGALIR